MAKFANNATFLLPDTKFSKTLKPYAEFLRKLMIFNIVFAERSNRISHGPYFLFPGN